MITYDEPKRLRNIAKHGYDFAEVTEDFFIGAIIFPGKDGRFVAVNAFDGRIVTVVFKPLGTEALSLISMRRASRYERSLHEQ